MALRYGGQAHRAAEVTAEADSHLRVLRDRARTAAGTTLTAEADRLCGVGGPTTRLTPEDHWLIGQEARRAVADVADDAACARALGTALRNARSPHGLGIAGAIARHALERDWDDTLGLWCQPGGASDGRLSRGGWAKVACWRAARDVQRVLEAGLWPTPLADARRLGTCPPDLRRPQPCRRPG